MRTNLQSRNGMTMVELVSALMIFIFILGALTMALNKVTGLWSSSSTGQYEQEKGDFILALLADDLSQAITDNAPPKENNTQPPPPTFLCDTDELASADECKIILQLIRYPLYKSVIKDDKPPALEAVFYTYYKNTLFRHAVPLEYSDTENPEHIGELLDQALTQVNDDTLHDEIVNYTENYLNPAPSANWDYSLLTERIDLPIILAGIEERYIDPSGSEQYNDSAVLSSGLRTLPEYLKLETRVLPDYLFIALRIYNETEWEERRRLDESENDTLRERKAPYLGKVFSRRYSFPSMKGARLQ